MALTSKQRQYLKGLAHGYDPVVRIGRGGATETVIAETKKSLQAHELIKVRIEVDDPALRKELAQTLAQATGAEVAGSVGKVAMLYRPREEKPTIKLP